MTQTDTSVLEGNTNSKTRSRKWCFTLNNYSEEEYTLLKDSLKDGKWIIGKEIGDDTKTPHLQGYVEYDNARTFASMKKLMPRAHIEKAKGTLTQNFNYCSKQNDYESNVVQRKPIKDPMKDKTPKRFQEEILEIVEREPDERKIYWYWDKEGGSGKTSLAKHLALSRKNKVLFCGGKGNDIKFGVTSFLDDKENELEICIFHFTRSIENFVSYEALESVKDGIFFSGKYESKMVIFNTPHVIVFANFPPDISKMSRDRWVVKEIDNSSP